MKKAYRTLKQQKKRATAHHVGKQLVLPKIEPASVNLDKTDKERLLLKTNNRYKIHERLGCLGSLIFFYGLLWFCWSFLYGVIAKTMFHLSSYLNSQEGQTSFLYLPIKSLVSIHEAVKEYVTANPVFPTIATLAMLFGYVLAKHSAKIQNDIENNTNFMKLGEKIRKNEKKSI